MKSPSLHHRILLIALAPMLLIGLFLYGYFAYNQIVTYETLFDERGITIAEQFSQSIEYGVISENNTLLHRLASTLLKNRDVEGIVITDAQNNILLTSGRLPVDNNDPFAQQPKASNCVDKTYFSMFCAPILRTSLELDALYEGEIAATETSHAIIGYTYIKVSKEDIVDHRNGVLATTISVMFAMLAITFFIGSRVALNIITPLQAIIQLVAKASQGDLTQRAIVGKNRELASLQSGINRMLDEIASHEKELQQKIDNATYCLTDTLARLKDKNEELEIERSRAVKANQSKSQFLANMSHEIRTPLNGITGMLELLDTTSLDAQQALYTHNLDIAIRSLQLIIDDILDISRIEAGKLRIHYQPISLADEITETVTLLAPSAHKKGLEIVLYLQSTLPQHYETDPTRLRQIITNLVANAIKYTERGSVTIDVTMTPETGTDERWLRVEVVDTGIGIAHDNIDSIFDIFTQVDNSHTRTQTGAGLGTSICKKLVSLLAGTIGVESEEGEGSKFWFELPLSSNDTARPPAHAFSAPLRFLLIEDHPRSREIVSGYIRQLSAQCDAQATSEAVVRTIRDSQDHGHPYDAVILCESSSESQRLSLAKDLRNQFKQLCPKLIHSTFYSGTTDLTLFDARIYKPITAKGLFNTWQSLVHPCSATDHPATPPAAPDKQLTILIAEDNPINALAITTFIGQLGHQPLLAKNGVEVLSQLNRGGIDLCLMDIRMPVMDGLSATRSWRSIETGSTHLPIIALTANATPEEEAEARHAGMDGFMTKPVSKEKLAAMIERHTEDTLTGEGE